jgi:hypothetical protein
MPRRNRKMYKKKPRRRYKPNKVTFKRVKAINLATSETKLQKDTLDFNNLAPGTTNIHHGNFWLTPYSTSACWNQIGPTSGGGIPADNQQHALNPPTNQAADNRLILPQVGQFIANGDTRSTRVGRRITMMSSSVEMVFHIRAIEDTSTTPSTYTYSANPEFRIIKGWVKDGVKGLQDLTHDISSLYGEIPYSKYKVQYDKVFSRRLQSSGLTNANLVGTYASVKYKFRWSPKKAITFNQTSSTVSGGNNTQYAGWTPFVYFFNPHSNLDISFDYLKRVNAFKDM